MKIGDCQLDSPLSVSKGRKPSLIVKGFLPMYKLHKDRGEYLGSILLDIMLLLLCKIISLEEYL